MFKSKRVISSLIFLIIELIMVSVEKKFIEIQLFDLSIGVSVILTAISVIFSIIFAYLVFIKERYSYNNSLLKEEIREVISLLIIFVSGFIIINIKNMFISQIFFISYSLIYIILFVFRMCRKIIKSEISILLKEIESKIQESINSCGEDENIELVKSLNKLNKTYLNEYEKRNINACVNVINKYSKFLENALKSRADKIINNIDKCDNTIKILSFFYENLIIKENNDLSSRLNILIIQRSLSFCESIIQCKITSLLSQSVEGVLDLIRDNENYIDIDEAFKNIYFLARKAYKNKCFEEFKIVNSKTIRLLKYYSIFKNDLEIRQLLFKYLTTIIVDLIKEKNEYLDFIIKELEAVVVLNKFSKDSKYVVGCLSNIIESECFKDIRVKEDIYNILYKTAKYSNLILDSTFINWIISYVNSDDIPSNEKRTDFKILLCNVLLENNKEVPSYLLPDYSSAAKENINHDEYNIECIKKIVQLLYKSVENKKMDTIRHLCENISNVIKQYSENNLKEQKQWMNIYFKLLNDSIFVQDDSIFECLIYYLRKSIFEADKEKKVGRQLSEHIIKSLYALADKYMINNDKVTIFMLELYMEFLSTNNNLYFVNANEKTKEEIYKHIYYIGLSCIENNCETVLKKISNFLGWEIVEKIKRNESSYALMIIDFVVKLYKLCYINEINKQTIVFIGTLFIIVGSFSETSSKYKSYKKRIIQNVGKTEYLNLLGKSRIIRESMQEEWKDLLGDKPQEKIDSFWEDLVKNKKNINGSI